MIVPAELKLQNLMGLVSFAVLGEYLVAHSFVDQVFVGMTERSQHL